MEHEGLKVHKIIKMKTIGSPRRNKFCAFSRTIYLNQVIAYWTLRPLACIWNLYGMNQVHIMNGMLASYRSVF